MKLKEKKDFMKLNNDLVTNLNRTAYLFNEINGQPNLWRTTFESIVSNKSEITGFLKHIFDIRDLQIILTGAGSSAFIGEILQQSFYKNTGIPTKAIATTDLVTHPEGYFQRLA